MRIQERVFIKRSNIKKQQITEYVKIIFKRDLNVLLKWSTPGDDHAISGPGEPCERHVTTIRIPDGLGSISAHNNDPIGAPRMRKRDLEDL